MRRILAMFLMLVENELGSFVRNLSESPLVIQETVCIGENS